MGLDQFNVAEDNKGGRKPTQESEEFERVKLDEAHTLVKCSEDYWNRLIKQECGVGKPEGEDITRLCRVTHLRPESVKEKIHDYELYEYPEVEEKRRRLESDNTDTEQEQEDSSLVDFVNAQT